MINELTHRLMYKDLMKRTSNRNYCIKYFTWYAHDPNFFMQRFGDYPKYATRLTSAIAKIKEMWRFKNSPFF